MKDIRIDYDTNWHRIHWRSILSAYSSAPFFEYYEFDLLSLYDRTYTFLAELNLDLLRLALKSLQWDRKIKLSTSYDYPDPSVDLREHIHPKREFSHPHFVFEPALYHQVFADRHGFIPDLSILDLLFNEGPNAGLVLQNSILKSGY